MIDDQTLFMTQLLTLWAVLDPISHLPLYLTATTGLRTTERRRAAVVAIFFAVLVLVAFGVGGQYLLHAMGISLLSFQISGGIILFLFALSMVLGEQKSVPVPDSNANGNSTPGENIALSIAVYPLAIPIIAGPGSMLSMVVLIDNNRFSLSAQVTTFLALAVVLSAMLGMFLIGSAVERFIGHAGTQLIRKVMGLILAALAVNLVLSAVASWLRLPPI